MWTSFNVDVHDLLLLWRRCIEASSSDVARGTISSSCIDNDNYYAMTINAMNATIYRLGEVRNAIMKMHEDRKREDDEDDEDNKWI